jgi:beta-lactamase class A
MNPFLRFAALLCGAATFFFSDAPAGGAPMTEAQAVRIVLTASPVSADLFAQSFLAQIPISQLTPIRDRMVAQLGTFQSVEGGNGQYTAHFVHGTMVVYIHLDSSGKIDGLRFLSPVIAGGTLQDAAKQLDALPGSVSYLVAANGKDLLASNADKKLGVGSTFKLAVLNALRKQIETGKRRWTDVVDLQPSWKSLPSGVLQSWPDGSPLTVSTLATEMISISDNTAADALIHLVGQKDLASFAYGNEPFLTTRQLFLLKTNGNQALRARYVDGNVRQRAQVLRELDELALPDVAKLDTDPSLNVIEWHFSNRELCSLMRGVHDLPLMSVNPGIASPDRWKHVAYKGGSDWGVISMTTWLQSKNGKSYCVSATWNNGAAAVDETTFSTAYGALIGVLAGMK